ncbi:MAG: ABC transporter permease [Treponema sp.]|jgi:ABC-2 type transport system permease protein|nr:ABC transporter permease [Treponema sp.]
MIQKLLHYIRFVFLLIKLRISRMMMFRVSFFGAFFTDSALFIIQLIAFSAIYSQVDSIGDWGWGAMLIFIGTYSLVNAISMVSFFFGVLEIPDKIRDGSLDLYITKPGNVLLRISFESVDPGSIPLLVLSAAIVAYGVSVLGIRVTAPVAAAYLALVLLGTLLWYDIMVLFRSITFFVFHNDIEWVESEMITLNMRIPGTLYKGAFKLLFCFLVPYGIIATVPAQLLTGALTLPGLLQCLGITAAFTLAALWFWRFALRRYKSASS